MELHKIYNNANEITKYVVDLKRLHEIINMRYEAGYKFGINLNNMKLLNDYLWLDSCGNTLKKREDSSDYYTTSCIPKESNICPHCGKGWTLDNIKDHVDTYDYENNIRIFYHKDCDRMRKLEEQRVEFIEIISKIYEITDIKLKPIPNEYCPCNHCSPWFIITTPDGDIKIGWRKRVINIEWLENYKSFKESFTNEDVTKGFGYHGDNSRFIHAWGIDKCNEYLGLAKESILS